MSGVGYSEYNATLNNYRGAENDPVLSLCVLGLRRGCGLLDVNIVVGVAIGPCFESHAVKPKTELVKAALSPRMVIVYHSIE